MNKLYRTFHWSNWFNEPTLVATYTKQWDLSQCIILYFCHIGYYAFFQMKTFRFLGQFSQIFDQFGCVFVFGPISSCRNLFTWIQGDISIDWKEEVCLWINLKGRQTRHAKSWGLAKISGFSYISCNISETSYICLLDLLANYLILLIVWFSWLDHYKWEARESDTWTFPQEPQITL